MTVRRLTNADRAQAEAMWREIFGDSEAFTAWYFSDRFLPEHSFGAFEQDRLVSMTLGRPTKIFIGGKPYDAMLISGVSTLPAYRKNGLMHAIMTRQIDHAREIGCACCYLHPVSESLYASLGFRPGTDALRIESDSARTHSPFDLRAGTDLTSMRAVYDTLLLTHDGMQLRDEAEWNALLQDYATDGGKTLVAYAENRPKGYLCYLADGTVSELFALCPSAYAALLDAVAERIEQPLKAIVPTDCGLTGERVYSMQYLVFNDAFSLPLKNGFCRLSY